MRLLLIISFLCYSFGINAQKELELDSVDFNHSFLTNTYTSQGKGNTLYQTFFVINEFHYGLTNSLDLTVGVNVLPIFKDGGISSDFRLRKHLVGNRWLDMGIGILHLSNFIKNNYFGENNYDYSGKRYYYNSYSSMFLGATVGPDDLNLTVSVGGLLTNKMQLSSYYANPFDPNGVNLRTVDEYRLGKVEKLPMFQLAFNSLFTDRSMIAAECVFLPIDGKYQLIGDAGIKIKLSQKALLDVMWAYYPVSNSSSYLNWVRYLPLLGLDLKL